MIDGASAAGRAHDRGGDGGRERGPAAGPLTGLAADLDQAYPGGEWLAPARDGLLKGFELLDKARALLVVLGGAVLLMYLGAKVERELQRRQLRVLDGAAAGGEVDLTEGAGGDRS